jgi:lysozyme family protein
LETAINMDVGDSVRFLQKSLNMQNYNKVYEDLDEDGRLGNITLWTLKRYLETAVGEKVNNVLLLLACMNGEQYIYYKANPQHKKFRGWFARTIAKVKLE